MILETLEFNKENKPSQSQQSGNSGNSGKPALKPLDNSNRDFLEKGIDPDIIKKSR